LRDGGHSHCGRHAYVARTQNNIGNDYDDEDDDDDHDADDDDDDDDDEHYVCYSLLHVFF